MDDTRTMYEAPAVLDLGTLVEITGGADNQGTRDDGTTDNLKKT